MQGRPSNMRLDRTASITSMLATTKVEVYVVNNRDNQKKETMVSIRMSKAYEYKSYSYNI
jgi:hypothetical protein